VAFNATDPPQSLNVASRPEATTMKNIRISITLAPSRRTTIAHRLTPENIKLILEGVKTRLLATANRYDVRSVVIGD